MWKLAEKNNMKLTVLPLTLCTELYIHFITFVNKYITFATLRQHFQLDSSI